MDIKEMIVGVGAVASSIITIILFGNRIMRSLAISLVTLLTEEDLLSRESYLKTQMQEINNTKNKLNEVHKDILKPTCLNLIGRPGNRLAVEYELKKLEGMGGHCWIMDDMHKYIQTETREGR